MMERDFMAIIIAIAVTDQASLMVGVEIVPAHRHVVDVVLRIQKPIVAILVAGINVIEFTVINPDVVAGLLFLGHIAGIRLDADAIRVVQQDFFPIPKRHHLIFVRLADRNVAHSELDVPDNDVVLFLDIQPDTVQERICSLAHNGLVVTHRHNLAVGGLNTGCSHVTKTVDKGLNARIDFAIYDNHIRRFKFFDVFLEIGKVLYRHNLATGTARGTTTQSGKAHHVKIRSRRKGQAKGRRKDAHHKKEKFGIHPVSLLGYPKIRPLPG